MEVQCKDFCKVSRLFWSLILIGDLKYSVWLGVNLKKIHQKGMYLKEIGLHAQSLLIVLGSVVNTRLGGLIRSFKKRLHIDNELIYSCELHKL